MSPSGGEARLELAGQGAVRDVTDHNGACPDGGRVAHERFGSGRAVDNAVKDEAVHCDTICRREPIEVVRDGGAASSAVSGLIASSSMTSVSRMWTISSGGPSLAASSAALSTTAAAAALARTVAMTGCSEPAGAR
ncbi:hypothetical protein [Sinomonas humi]|uniref:Uncharacterized protein n=1 Tax=Sinomonas humi TaxID=1338436 RepID=A0A0B2AHJ8_9MICC|nr:hypothetical protein [Sinomonas humi]KHL01378.1 hypothetical protein LK10_15940 [Sinomonas humi]